MFCIASSVGTTTLLLNNAKKNFKSSHSKFLPNLLYNFVIIPFRCWYCLELKFLQSLSLIKSIWSWVLIILQVLLKGILVSLKKASYGGNSSFASLSALSNCQTTQKGKIFLAQLLCRLQKRSLKMLLYLEIPWYLYEKVAFWYLKSWEKIRNECAGKMGLQKICWNSNLVHWMPVTIV